MTTMYGCASGLASWSLVFALVGAAGGAGGCASSNAGGGSGGAGGAAGGGASGSGGGGGVPAGGAGGAGGSGAGGAGRDAAGGGGAGGARQGADAAVPGGAADRPTSDAPAQAGRAFVYVGGTAAEIRILQLDTQTGALSAKGSAEAGNNPGFLAFHPSKKYLLAANRSPSRLTSFAIDAVTGALTKINDAATEPGNGAAAVVIHRSGKWAFLAHTGSSHVTVHAIRDNGAVDAPVDVQQPGMFTHMAMPDPAGKFLFVACQQSDYVAQLSFNADSGKLAPNTPPNVPSMAGAGPRHIAFHPTAKFAYVINETNDTLTSFNYNATMGLLSDPENVPTVPNAPDAMNTTAHVVVHPTGRFVYGSNRGHNSVAIYAVNEMTGRLTLLGHETGEGMIRTPRNFTVDDSGRFLLVANQASNNVLVFRIQPDGKLMRVGEPVPTAAGPTWVGVL